MTKPLAFAAAAMIIAGMLGSTTTVNALAAQQTTQAPGYYRMGLGDFEITALSDGAFPIQTDELLSNIPAKEPSAALGSNFSKSPVATSASGYLLNTGAKLVLIDTGAGTLLGPGVGKLVGNLHAAGYQPEQVDEIYITHMHPDHIGGLLSERKAAFPNAIVRASRAEANYWLSKSFMAAAPAEERQRFAEVAAVFKPYLAAGHLKTFDGETELMPGIRALPNAGHTSGHTAYTAESGGGKILFCGDTLHIVAVQPRYPGVADRFDVDAAAASTIRTALFKDAAAHGYWVAGAHLSFPGIGHLRTDGRGFEYIPLNHTVP
jgi:glyoxylase-like metal-dependent hydrolase (beta-lactamase superfamily II)